ncbi:MAG: DUF3298 and DUF4163 domain-containing protein [Lachnospiraceae bacterium]|jgi:hypothetical protein|nr:DUF3298 and DUF4163 domain-containing protein [Lachnospiraceae bacterium]MCI9019054.1 DUF3298 and DUF4163 domain-containing protein [Lachnospiraceae bacterium]MCI9681475.1 DUF3298 and DUF4163 domain-containing protein [Lachnospiraceae bacterium]
MRDKKLEEMRQDYENIKIPAELRQRVEAGIRQAKEETKMKKRSKVIVYTGRVAGGVAAAMVMITVMANSGAAIAHAMAKIPVIGAIAEVVTFREYESTDNNNNMEADIKIPEVSVKNEDGTVNEETTQKINKSIQEYTDEIIAQYEADVKAAGEGEGHMNVELDYSVITDSDRLFSIRFDQLLVMASGTQMVKIYHIDKQTGEMIGLDGLFKDGADYITVLSENIKEQMKERMAADESLVYWVDNEDMSEWNFESIKEDNTFYVNENGKLTIVFDEYEVAPGYMGSVEFEIPTEIIQDLVQEGFLK